MSFVLVLILLTGQHGEILEQHFESLAGTVGECRELMEKKLPEITVPDGATVHKLCINMTPLPTDEQSKLRPNPSVKL